MRNIITINGNATMAFTPDTTKVEVKLSKVCTTFSEAVKASEEDVKQIKGMLTNLNFDKKEIKTSDFDIRPLYKSKKDKDGFSKSALVGYEYNHTLNFTFPIDNERLSKILNTLTRTYTNAKVEFSFILKDRESARNMALAKAIANAKEKAKIIADASNVTLGNITNITYGIDNDSYDYHRSSGCFTLCADMVPEDVNIYDNVTISWKII